MSSTPLSPKGLYIAETSLKDGKPQTVLSTERERRRFILSQSRIAVILPSRGLIFSKTVASLLQNLAGLQYYLFQTHNLPIPDCFEVMTSEALKLPITHLFLVEEDVVLPQDILKKMILENKDYIAVDYKIGQHSTIYRHNGEITWTGLGCTLIKREIFNKITPPYFVGNTRHIVEESGRTTFPEANHPPTYGGQDINFCLKLKEAGIILHQLEGEICTHLRLKELGKRNSNNGVHQIEEM